MSNSESEYYVRIEFEYSYLVSNLTQIWEGDSDEKLLGEAVKKIYPKCMILGTSGVIWGDSGTFWSDFSDLRMQNHRVLLTFCQNL